MDDSSVYFSCIGPRVEEKVFGEVGRADCIFVQVV